MTLILAHLPWMHCLGVVPLALTSGWLAAAAAAVPAPSTPAWPLAASHWTGCLGEGGCWCDAHAPEKLVVGMCC